MFNWAQSTPLEKNFLTFNIPESSNKIGYLIKRNLKMSWVPNFMKIGAHFNLGPNLAEHGIGKLINSKYYIHN